MQIASEYRRRAREALEGNIFGNTCITESRKMMNGHKWEYFCLQFSFIAWMIVGLFCLGVGTLWVAAYMNAANAAFYEDLKNQPVIA